MKSHPDLQNLPVIIFSAYITRESNEERFDCDAIILKLFDLGRLANKINELLEAVA